MSDYLWDKSGKPDPEIEELEKALGSLKYKEQPFNYPVKAKPEGLSIKLLIAACLVLALTVGLLQIFITQTNQKLSSTTTMPIKLTTEPAIDGKKSAEQVIFALSITNAELKKIQTKISKRKNFN
ncbi:MAG: hypothetical protein IPK14_11850 [Blastocatellia bacterium]|nr:hypothetical protein [Blastocatellia bacterium]